MQSATRFSVFPIAAAVLSLSVLGGCATADAQDGVGAQDASSYTLTADRVAIYNLAGTAELVSHGGSDVIVEVRRNGGDRAVLGVEVDVIDGREALRVIYPEDEIRYPPGPRGGSLRLRVNSDGTFGHGGSFFRGNQVRISTSGGGSEAWADLRVLVPEGRDVAFYLGVGETRVDGVRGPLRLDTGSGAVRTANTVGNLQIDTGSGEIHVTGVEGDVDLDTGSGSVEAGDIRGQRLAVDTGSGSVRGERIAVESLGVGTGSGSIRLAEVTASSIAVDTGSGSIRLAEVTASSISVDTGSGSVGLGLASDVDEIDVETGSGSVVIRVAESVGANVRIRTGSGGIQAEIPLVVRSSRRGRFEGVIGDGEGEINVETGSGGVELLPI